MKQSHRIIRDVSLVIAFCGGFLTLIWFANSLQAPQHEETSSEFSQYRVKADEAIQKRNLDVSLQNLRSMVAKDPYDGRAQYTLAQTLFSKIIERKIEAANSRRREASASTEGESSAGPQRPLDRQGAADIASSGPRSTNPVAEDDLRSLIDQAIQEYQLAEKHVRYRLRSQFQLAVLWVAKGEDEAALDNLEKFVAAGGVTRSGLDQIEQFGMTFPIGATKLHAYPRFTDLVNREIDNRIVRGNYRGLESNSRPQRRRRSPITKDNPFPTVAQPDTNLWNYLERLNRDLIPYRIKLIDFIRVFLKKINIVVRDHDDLEIQLFGGTRNDVHQSRNQLWSQPTILLVQNQKPTMLTFVQSCQSKQSQPDAQHVLN